MESHKMSSINVDRIPFARKKYESHGRLRQELKEETLSFERTMNFWESNLKLLTFFGKTI